MSKEWVETDKGSLKTTHVYCVRVCGFTFRFNTLDELRTTLTWFQQPTHPSTRLPDSKWLRSEHGVAQRWFERLPAGIKKGSRRTRVVQALQRALTRFSK